MQPYTSEGESAVVRAARVVEERLHRGATARGVAAPTHVLMSKTSPEALLHYKETTT